MADGASGGRTRITSCGPTPGVAPARATQRVAKVWVTVRPHSPSMTVRFGLRAPRVGRRPSAQARRFYEPQKQRPFVLGRSQRRTNNKAEAASKRRCASPPHPGAAGRPLTREPSYSLSPQIPARAQPKACPSSPPRVRLTAAPLSLRHVCRRPRQFLPDWPSANRQNMSFKRAGAPKGRFAASLYPILFSRACAIHSISAYCRNS